VSAENVELIKGMMSGFEGADSEAIREMLPAVIPDGKVCRYREFYDEDAARAPLND
jgi:hypothetical protein